MSLQAFVSNYVAFNDWANQRILDWLNTLDRSILAQKTPSSFDTIHKTLQHIIDAQVFWFAFITGQDLKTFNWKKKDNDIEKVMSDLATSSAELKTRFSAFSEQELLEVLHLEMRWSKNDLSRYEYILHVVNHSTFHRGQIITMARCLGIEQGIPITDYNMFRTP